MTDRRRAREEQSLARRGVLVADMMAVEQDRATRVRFMREQHLISGHQSATILNRRLRRGEFGEKGCVVTPEDLACDSCGYAKMRRATQSKKKKRSVPVQVFAYLAGGLV